MAHKLVWPRKPVLFGAATVIAGLALYWAYRYFVPRDEEDLVPASIVGVQHLGPDYNIGEFYVNGYYGSNVGREGGGGGFVCCVMLPSKWRPGLVAEVKWEVNDWSKEDIAEIKAENYRSIRTEGLYGAIVPIEKYEIAHDVYVHFFPEGKVRIVSTGFGPLHPLHPVPYGAGDGGEIATTGHRVSDLFANRR